MFCKIIEQDKWIVVRASLIGRILYLITFGRIKPSMRFDRDFGPGCDDGKCLEIKSPCSVFVNGSIKGYSA